MNQPDIAPFVVIDLVSQASAVARHVRGWSTNQILAWLRRQGELESRPSIILGRETYFFRSGSGFTAAFFLDGEEFTFISDNTAFRPK
jgi:hypothetical protein